MTRETIRHGLRSLGDEAPEQQWVLLCFLAGGNVVEIDTAEANAAFRRASLLLATGGDPRRGLELSSRAVGSVAGDLDTPSRREQLAAGLAALQADAADLEDAGRALALLRDDPDLAWRCFAAALLAEELGADDPDD